MKTFTFYHNLSKAIHLFLLLMILLPVTYGQYDYYYSHNGLKRELDILTDRFVVKPLPSFISLQIKELLQQRLPNLRTRELKNHLSPGFIEIMLYTRFEDISSLFHDNSSLNVNIIV